jgi:hypothetical protein
LILSCTKISSKKFDIIFRGFGEDESQVDPASYFSDGLPDVVTACATTGGKDQRDSATRFSTSGFFHGSVSAKSLSIPLGPFQIFLKISGDIRNSRCTTGVIDTGAKRQKSSIRKVLIC